ncbi:MAG: agmatinase [Desulfurococcaceae archaeon]
MFLQPPRRPFACIEREGKGAAILGIPLDISTSYKPGTRFAPETIRRVACELELSTLAGEILEDAELNDIGDVVLPPGALQESLERIMFVVRGADVEVIRDFFLFLGGEHTLTLATTKALENEIDTVVIFDAHLDARDEYLGSRINHATFARRMLEEGFKVIYVGARAFSKEELEFIRSLKNAIVFGALDVFSEKTAYNSLGRVYVSVDMDVIDPAYAPGVGNPEPLGLTPLQAIREITKVLKNSDALVGLDVVEVNPLVDVNDVTSALASKLALEVMAIERSRTGLPSNAFGL